MKLNDVLSKIDNEISTYNSLPDNFELSDEAKKAYELILSQTIHSFFRFPPRTFEDDEISNNYNKIIDQIDMIIM